VLAAHAELVVGGTLAFGVFAAFGAFSVAGKILDVQTGFGIGNGLRPGHPRRRALVFHHAQHGGGRCSSAWTATTPCCAAWRFRSQRVPPGSPLASMTVDAVLRSSA
jgi:flagellar biosynthetic protein FliR